MTSVVFGCGYIGAQLVADLLGRGENVVVFDNAFSTDAAVLRDFERVQPCRVVSGSVADRSAVRDAMLAAGSIDKVYFTAGQSSAALSRRFPEYTEETNLRGPRIVLDQCVERGVLRVVFTSSMRVLGPALTSDVDELTSFGPSTDLAHLSHVYVESLAKMYSRAFDISCSAVRLGIVYGRGPVVKRTREQMTAPNLFCLQACRRESLCVTRDGALYHPLIHVKDAAQAMLLSAESPSSERFVATNAVTEVLTMTEVASRVAREARAVGMQVDVSAPSGVALPPRPPVVTSSLPAAGFTATRCLDQGIREMLELFCRV